jgi:hypothetical protein
MPCATGCAQTDTVPVTIAPLPCQMMQHIPVLQTQNQFETVLQIGRRCVMGGRQNQRQTVRLHLTILRFFFLARQPPVGHGLLIHEVPFSRLHTTTQYSR